MNEERIRYTFALLKVESKDLKMLRETLCQAQSFYGVTAEKSRERIQLLIDEIDRHRPLGSDGKHGKLHTATCGCEDV